MYKIGDKIRINKNIEVDMEDVYIWIGEGEIGIITGIVDETLYEVSIKGYYDLIVSCDEMEKIG